MATRTTTTTTTRRTLTGRQARKELRRVKALSRRGPLAPYRLAVAVTAALIVAGESLLVVIDGGDLLEPMLRFAAGALLGWVTWGAIDSVFADVERRQEREADIARRLAGRQHDGGGADDVDAILGSMTTQQHP